MHIVSWNVASWPKSCKFILQRHRSVKAWLEGHKIDIICLQEVKTTDQKLVSEKAGHGLPIEGYETFWCPCTSSKTKGFNGVATFARTGMTVCANKAPLDDEPLNAEGRCLLTDHGRFCIVNVYVPNDGPGSVRLPLKMRFLRSVRRLLQAQRAAGKAVMLIGDLNISRRPQDVTWGYRVLHIPTIAASLERLAEGDAKTLATKVTAGWADIKAWLARREITAVKVNAPTRGIKLDRWRVMVPSRSAKAKPGTLTPLGSPFESEARATRAYRLEHREVRGEEGASAQAAAAEAFVARRADETYIADLQDIVARYWPGSGDEPFTAAKTFEVLSRRFGEPVSSPPCREWLAALLEEDGMVDTFAAEHPRSADRFTCWDQYRNRRYENEGTRIDYILVDRAFYTELRDPAPGVPLYGSTECHPDSVKAARNAVTSYGRWRPAPFDGSGIVDGRQEDYEAQFYAPHCGLVYTPPQYSDHIGVSAVLQPAACPADPSRPDRYNKATRRTQPHLQQTSIASFFKAAPPGATGAGGMVTPAATTPASRRSTPSPSFASSPAWAPPSQGPVGGVALDERAEGGDVMIIEQASIVSATVIAAAPVSSGLGEPQHKARGALAAAFAFAARTTAVTATTTDTATPAQSVLGPRATAGAVRRQGSSSSSSKKRRSSGQKTPGVGKAKAPRRDKSQPSLLGFCRKPPSPP